MNQLVPSEIIERLERRHEELIGELDVLNTRLEQTLNSFSQSAPTVEHAKGPTALAQQEQENPPGQEISPA
ncbi:MAG: hypothetical protein MK171_04410 [Pirellulales bacterium]|nr:hypothetical protein [Pirellulales bacterium]